MPIAALKLNNAPHARSGVNGFHSQVTAMRLVAAGFEIKKLSVSETESGVWTGIVG
jgi:hypothetical protein